MSDFAAQVGELVKVARASANQQREAMRIEEEGAARRLKETQERAAALIAPIWERIRVAGDASDGAITADQKHQGKLTTFDLHWKEGEPKRSLRILVDEADGMVQAAWVIAPGYGRSVDAPHVSVDDFEMANVEAAILLLADQRRWAKGALPMIPW